MTPRALVIDDSLTVRADIQSVLRAAGFEVTLAATLGEGRRALEAGAPNLVVLDVLLPDGNGVDLLGEIKRGDFGAALPVILLTSETVVRDRVRGWSTGADDYVGKPYDRGYLTARALELVRREQAPAHDPRSVLVVEPSPSLGRALCKALADAGHTTRLATTAEEALRLALVHRPAAVVVDTELPGMDGATMVRRMKLEAGLRSVPVVLLTPDDDQGEGLRALEDGVDALLARSAAPELVPARLGPLLRGLRDPEHDASPSALGPKRLLLVDARPEHADRVAESLAGEGYELARALDAAEALRLLGVQPADGVLIVEPGLEGEAAELVCALRERPAHRHTTVVVLGRTDDPNSMVSWINLGADDQLAETAPVEVLRARIRALFRTRHVAEERRRTREARLRQTLDAAEAHAARELAEARAALLADLAEKNEELRRTNELLAAARDRAERESHFKSRFLANMSHELRTPLNAIIGFSEILAQELFGALNDRQAEYVGHVHASGRHLLGLINEVLDLSKIAAGRLELQREWVDAATVAEATVATVRPLADKQGVTLSWEVDRALPYLRLDAQRLRQILYNLLSNGIKFTQAGGSVRLTATIEGDWMAISVIDTGIGIPRESFPRLFQEFEQLENGLLTKPEGTGLGLALSRHLVELMGGTLGVESEHGVGSTFTARLPLPAASPPTPAQPNPAPGLPGRVELLDHLRDAIARADRSGTAVHLVAARVSRVADVSALPERVGSGDFAARVEDDVLALVVESAPSHLSHTVERRFAALLAEVCGTPHLALCTASYPFDAVEADALVAWALDRVRGIR